MAADVTYRLNVLATLTKAFDLAEATSTLTYAKELHFTNGTGATQMNFAWHDQRLVASGANSDLDLFGVLLDVFGTTASFLRVNLLVVYSAATNTTVLTIGGATSNAWATWLGATTHTVKVRPGGSLALCAPDVTGYAVTTATADQLRISNAAGADAVYDIIIGGTV